MATRARGGHDGINPVYDAQDLGPFFGGGVRTFNPRAARRNFWDANELNFKTVHKSQYLVFWKFFFEIIIAVLISKVFYYINAVAWKPDIKDASNRKVESKSDFLLPQEQTDLLVWRNAD